MSGLGGKESSKRVLESAWRTHVEPSWSARRIGSIRKSEVQAWAVTLGESRGATTVIRATGVLRAILQVAVDDRLIAANPAQGVKLPRKMRSSRNYLTHGQVRLLAAQSRGRDDLVFFLAYTGLRWSELAGLRVGLVNPLLSRLTVAEGQVAAGSKVNRETPKSGRERTISYPRFLGEILNRLIAGRRPNEFVFGDGIRPLRLPHSKNGWLAQTVRRCQAIDPDFPNITAHELRHTAASLAIAVRANPKLAQNMLGHASAAYTLDIYADLFPDDMDRLADGLDAAIAESIVVAPLSREVS